MQGKHITAITLTLILCAAGIGYALVQKPGPPPADPKPKPPTTEELYVRCVEAKGADCEEIFAASQRRHEAHMKKREQLEKTYADHLAKCLAWKSDKNNHQGDFDGTNGCSLSASLHMQKLAKH
jgi:hypothetical protein